MFGVFFGVNVGKTGDFYRGSCEWGRDGIIENAEILRNSGCYRWAIDKVLCCSVLLQIGYR